MSGVSIRVAFQGELGAYSEDAARRHWPNGEIELLPVRSCADVARLVERGDADRGLLPIENSLAGSVVATYDALAQSDGLSVVGEVTLPIHHCLLAAPGAAVDTVRVAESHPVALAQCLRFLESHPWIVARAAYDTAGAARDVAASHDRTRAAIAGRGAAERFGLEVLEANIEDRSDNQTRFLAIARAAARVPLGTPAKTAVIATTENRPGALHRLLRPLAESAINLSKLESRPKGEPWMYSFFLEFEHELTPTALADVLAALRATSRELRVLGTFARADASRAATSHA